MVFIGLPDIPAAIGLPLPDTGPWYLTDPLQWLYPVQTVIYLFILFTWRKYYHFAPHQDLLYAAAVGAVGIAIWLAPGYLYRTVPLQDGWWRHFGFASRCFGFDPTAVWDAGTFQYRLVVVFRFLRLVVVVPLVEEIFWRGFLMRYLADLDGDYWQVPFGTHHRRCLVIVTGMFVLIHSPVDYAAALIYGLLAYHVAVKTKSLSACVVMHAVANLLLGIYVMATQQWGYW